MDRNKKEVYAIARSILRKESCLSAWQFNKRLEKACRSSEEIYQKYYEIRAREWERLLETMEEEFSIAF